MVVYPYIVVFKFGDSIAWSSENYASLRNRLEKLNPDDWAMAQDFMAANTIGSFCMLPESQMLLSQTRDNKDDKSNA
jgi:hypothetical protein